MAWIEQAIAPPAIGPFTTKDPPMTPFVDFTEVWLAYNDELLAKGQFAVRVDNVLLPFAVLVVSIMAMVMYELFSVVEMRTAGRAHRGSQSA